MTTRTYKLNNNMAKAYTKDQVQVAVENSISYSDIFRQLGIKINGGSYIWVKRLIDKFNLDTSHFLKASEIATLKFQSNKINDNRNTIDISKDYRLNASRLHKFMIDHGMEYKCSVCELDEWAGIPIRLDIDHIDGNGINNHINNLQFLCPNCHRQKTIKYVSKSFRYKNTKFISSRVPIPSNKCKCGKDIERHSTNCRSCSKKGLCKIVWPSDEYLRQIVWEIPTSKLSKQLGVSDVAISKRCKILGISKPPNGYWRKKETGNI